MLLHILLFDKAYTVTQWVNYSELRARLRRRFSNPELDDTEFRTSSVLPTSLVARLHAESRIITQTRGTITITYSPKLLTRSLQPLADQTPATLFGVPMFYSNAFKGRVLRWLRAWVDNFHDLGQRRPLHLLPSAPAAYFDAASSKRLVSLRRAAGVFKAKLYQVHMPKPHGVKLPKSRSRVLGTDLDMGFGLWVWMLPFCITFVLDMLDWLQKLISGIKCLYASFIKALPWSKVQPPVAPKTPVFNLASLDAFVAGINPDVVPFTTSVANAGDGYVAWVWAQATVFPACRSRLNAHVPLDLASDTGSREQQLKQVPRGGVSVAAANDVQQLQDESLVAMLADWRELKLEREVWRSLDFILLNSAGLFNRRRYYTDFFEPSLFTSKVST